MSTQIPVAFAQKFLGDFRLLAQQQTSRLEAWVRKDPDKIEGKYAFFDRIGATTVQRKTSRHMATPIVNTAHSRRRIGISDWVWADLIDKADTARLLAAGSLPAKYQQNATMAFNRKKDELILAAAIGNSYAMDEDDTATATSLTSDGGTIIAVGATGLTLAKVLEANYRLKIGEVDPMERRCLVISPYEENSLLQIAQVTSKDYNDKPVITDGKVMRLLGFDIILSNLLTVASTTRKCVAFTETAIGLAIGQEMDAKIEQRADLNYSTQVYLDYSADATRVEGVKVVEIDCLTTG